jgi:hypothetical protein
LDKSNAPGGHENTIHTWMPISDPRRRCRSCSVMLETRHGGDTTTTTTWNVRPHDGTGFPGQWSTGRRIW